MALSKNGFEYESNPDENVKLLWSYELRMKSERPNYFKHEKDLREGKVPSTFTTWITYE